LEWRRVVLQPSWRWSGIGDAPAVKALVCEVHGKQREQEVPFQIKDVALP
jgi:hypothetical protein